MYFSNNPTFPLTCRKTRNVNALILIYFIHPPRLCSSRLPSPSPPASSSPPLLSPLKSRQCHILRGHFTLSYLSAHPWRSEAGWHQRLAGRGRHIYLAVTACGQQDCRRHRRASQNIDLVWNKVRVLCVMYQNISFTEISLKSSFCQSTSDIKCSAFT